MHNKIMLHDVSASVYAEGYETTDHAIVCLSCQPRFNDEFLIIEINARKHIDDGDNLKGSEDLHLTASLYFTNNEAAALVHAMQSIIQAAAWQADHPAPSAERED